MKIRLNSGCRPGNSFIIGVRAGRYSVKICGAGAGKFCVCREKYFIGIACSRMKIPVDNFEEAEDQFPDLKFEMQRMM